MSIARIRNQNALLAKMKREGLKRAVVKAEQEYDLWSPILEAAEDGVDIEYRNDNGEWGIAKNCLDFHHELSRYRIKKNNVVVVNGFEVVGPLTEEPTYGSMAYVASTASLNYVLYVNGYGMAEGGKEMFRRGLLFSTREDAIAYAKATLGKDPKGAK